MNQETTPPKPPENGTTAALGKLLGQINIPTLLAIFAMNGWNIGATNNSNQQREAQVQQAVREIHILHEALDDTQKRQQQSLDNQGRLLENQQRILEEIHRWQQSFKNP